MGRIREQMLLRVGVVSMVLAVVLATAVAIGVNLSGGDDEPAPPVALAKPQATETPTEESEPDIGGKRGIEDKPRQKLQTAETPTEPEERNDMPRSFGDESPPREKPASRAQALPVPSEDWTRPSREELSAANGPRYYPPREDAALTLTIGAIGIYDAPVLNSTSNRALSRGVVHIPETPMPWDERQEKNVYLAGHRVGSPGTGSRTIFYNLDKLSDGDPIVLKDRSGNAYNYRVSEVFVVEPDAGWVLDTERNRDMVTLQTCTYPTFENRLIIRADRV